MSATSRAMWYANVGVRELRADEISPAVLERFRARLRRDPSGCLVWTGARNGNGYGVVRIGFGRKGRIVLAHRLAYAIAHGSAPADRVIDHRADLCVSRACCDDPHLRAVPLEENSPGLYGLECDELPRDPRAIGSSEIPF